MSNDASKPVEFDRFKKYSEPDDNHPLDKILDEYYAPIKMPDNNREGLIEAINNYFQSLTEYDGRYDLLTKQQREILIKYHESALEQLKGAE